MSATGKAILSNRGSYILAWLLSQRKGGTTKAITKALPVLSEGCVNDTERCQVIDDEVAALRQAGWVKRVRHSSFELTPDGRKDTNAALKWKKPPAKADWGRVKAQYLIVVLSKWFEDSANAPAVPHENASPAPIEPVLPTPAEPLFELPKDDAAFAAHVLAAARASKTGRFGEDKVFISHVLRQLTDDGARVIDAEKFKNRLFSVHSKRLLSLSRADLVEAMDPRDVEASETRYRNATFHFVQV